MNSEYLVLETIALLFQQGYVIQDIIRICKNISKTKYIDSLEELLMQGYDIESALLKCPFNSTFKEYFAFFKNSNALHEAINQSISICKTRDRIVNRMKKELSYPIILLIFLLFFSLFLVFGLLPQVKDMFIQFQGEISFVQNMLFAIFTYLPMLVFICIIFTILLFIFCIYVVKKQRLDMLDRYILKLPGIAQAIKKYYSLKFAIYYNELLKNGYDSSQIIEILYQQMADNDIKMLVYEIHQEILQGEKLEEIIAHFDYFEKMFIEYFYLLLNNMQKHKSLDDYIYMTITLIETKTKKYVKRIVPIIYGFVAGFVILVYIAIIIPMMNVVNMM